MTGLGLTLDGVDQLATSIGALAGELAAGLDDQVHRQAAQEVLGQVSAPLHRAEITPAGFTIGVGGPYFPGREVFLERPLTAAEADVVNTYLDHLEQLLDTLQGGA